jgi:hypothetical protein
MRGCRPGVAVARGLHPATARGPRHSPRPAISHAADRDGEHLGVVRRDRYHPRRSELRIHLPSHHRASIPQIRAVQRASPALRGSREHLPDDAHRVHVAPAAVIARDGVRADASTRAVSFRVGHHEGHRRRRSAGDPDQSGDPSGRLQHPPLRSVRCHRARVFLAWSSCNSGHGLRRLCDHRAHPIHSGLGPVFLPRIGWPI